MSERGGIDKGIDAFKDEETNRAIVGAVRAKKELETTAGGDAKRLPFNRVRVCWDEGKGGKRVGRVYRCTGWGERVDESNVGENWQARMTGGIREQEIKKKKNPKW